METNQVSATALITAYARAYHATFDTSKIFDDYLAEQIQTEENGPSIRQATLIKRLRVFEVDHRSQARIRDVIAGDVSNFV